MIENFAEVKTYLESQKDTEEIKNYLQGINKLSLDGVKSFLESDEQGKGYLQTYTDSKVTKAIETHTKTTLPGLVQAEVLKLNPNKNPLELKYEELERRFEEKEKEVLRNKLELKTSKLLVDKNIPIDFLSFIKGDNDEIIMSNLTGLEKALGDYSKIIRGQIIKEGSSNPHKNFDSNTTVNPYAKETRSLTRQMELEISNPTLALQYKNQANQ